MLWQAVDGDGGTMAWRQAVARNLLAGAIDEEHAKVLAGLLDGAARSKPAEGSKAQGAAAEMLALVKADAARRSVQAQAGSTPVAGLRSRAKPGG